jgi:hypothetical protein
MVTVARWCDSPIVGGCVVPAGPDDADPGAGDDAGGMRVAFPRRGHWRRAGRPRVTAVGLVGEGGDRFAGAGGCCPAEVDAAGLARGLGDRRCAHRTATPLADRGTGLQRPHGGLVDGGGGEGERSVETIGRTAPPFLITCTSNARMPMVSATPISGHGILEQRRSQTHALVASVDCVSPHGRPGYDRAYPVERMDLRFASTAGGRARRGSSE